MQLLEVIKKLISFRTVTGNTDEIEKCLQYVKKVLEPSGAKIDICYHQNASPVIFARNVDTEHFDVLILGHLDVVPADEKMFSVVVKDGFLYGRGTLDMKSFAAVAMKSMETVMHEKLPLKFGFILSTDEEKGSKSLEAFLEKRPNLKADIVLDNDVGGDITKIIIGCKNPVFVRLNAKGISAHGSTPWCGMDANEALMKTWQNIQKFYPPFNLKTGAPKNIWIDTAHMAMMSGGKVSNIISDEATALIDFRLTDTSSVEDLKKVLNGCMEEGVSFEIEMQSIAVTVDRTNETLLLYRDMAQAVVGQKIEFEYMGGATDSRAFYQRGATLIMHSGSGDGMHAANEYADFKSVEQVSEIQERFLRKLACK